MTDKKTRTWFTNRQFVAMIRTALDAAGQKDIAVSRQWIDQDTPGYIYLMHVPVGPALSLPLRASPSFLHAENEDDLRRHAEEFAKALVNLRLAEKRLLKYAQEVRIAASDVIASARADGLDLLLDRVDFKPTYAYQLSSESWKDAAYQVLASVMVQHTSFFLRPEVSGLYVEKPVDLAKDLANLIEVQRVAQERIAELDALGADLIVDQITLDLLDAHGLDAGEVLTDVWKKQCLNLKVEHLGRECSLSLISSDGRVTAAIMLDDAIWNGEYLWFTGVEQSKDHQHLIGKSLGDLVRHPVFASRPIADVVNQPSEQVVFDLSDKVLFDTDSSRFWREERLAA